MLSRILVVLLLTSTIISLNGVARTGDKTQVSLTGLVSSRAHGPMEGVLVSVKGIGSGVTITVVTDSLGRYAFPRDRLQPGKYNVGVRAVGYDLTDVGIIQVTAATTKQLDLELRKTQDLGSQLTSAEWLLSVPGTQKQKEFLFRCVVCHTLTPIVQSTHNAKEFLAVMNRMRNYALQSFLLKPIKLPDSVSGSPEAEQLIEKATQSDRMPPRKGLSISRGPGHPDDAYAAQYLSSINLSTSGRWEYQLKTLPLPKGKATRVIITEYDLPRRESQPHDALVDAQGLVWYIDFGLPYLGRLNPSTGEIKEWRMPVLKPGLPEGSNGLELDRDGNPWTGRMFQDYLAKFDKKTEQVTAYVFPEDAPADVGSLDIPNGKVVLMRHSMVDPPASKQGGMLPDRKVMPAHRSMVSWQGGMQSDGKVVLVRGKTVVRLDPKTGEFSTASYSVPKGASGAFYGWTLDSKGTVYGAAQDDGAIGEIDEKGGKLILYRTAITDSGPRRVQMDAQDRLWFAEYLAHKLGMFDTKTKQMKEWTVPTPWSGGYDVVVDRNGEVWGGGMHTDRVYRFNPKTEQFTEYLVPRELNLRLIDVDNSTTPVTVWVGSNHQAKLLKLEPLD